MKTWTERSIAQYLYSHTFAGRHLVCIPNCYLPGSECDLLLVRKDLRLMDIEIKISRSDLRADRLKDKWHKEWDFAAHGWRRPKPEERERVDHPKNIWKHYYCLPREIWAMDLINEISPASGVIFLEPPNSFNGRIHVYRQAKPNKHAEPIGIEKLTQLAGNLCGRMWDAVREVEIEKADRAYAARKATA